MKLTAKHIEIKFNNGMTGTISQHMGMWGFEMGEGGYATWYDYSFETLSKVVDFAEKLEKKIITLEQEMQDLKNIDNWSGWLNEHRREFEEAQRDYKRLTGKRFEPVFVEAQ